MTKSPQDMLREMCADKMGYPFAVLHAIYALDRADALAAALREAITWDGQDDEGVDAVWLHDATAALAAWEARK